MTLRDQRSVTLARHERDMADSQSCAMHWEAERIDEELESHVIYVM